MKTKILTDFQICISVLLSLGIYMMVLIPPECFYKSSWVEYHRNHCFMTKGSKPNTLLLGDSIAVALSRHPNKWNEYCALINALNLGIGGDRVENFLWQAIDLHLSPYVKNVVILCGTNNIPLNTPRHIADCIFSVASILQKKSSGINVSVYRLISLDQC